MVIDDNEAIHQDFRKILCSGSKSESALSEVEEALFGENTSKENQLDFQVDSAFQGRDGMEMVRRARETNTPYAMAFVDVRMPPGWDGVETTIRIWEKDPEVQIVICTAYSDYSWDDMLERLGRSDRLVILKKPFDNIEVRQLANALSEKWRLARQAKSRLEDLEKMVNLRTADLQRTNEQLERETERANELAAAKSEFLAHMSHEIRTPLNGIIGVAELLQSTPLNHHQRDLLDTIRFSGDNLLTVLNDILDYSKIENDKLELDFHAFNLLNLIDEIVGLFYHRALEKKLELSYQVDPGLPLDYIGDGVRIRQVMVNLVSNALKFTDGGEVRIDIRPSGEPSEEDRIGLTFSVQDSGIGIPKDRLSKLFEPFNQLDASTSRRYGGSGLGLAICQRLVNLMGGAIHLESEPGVGSVFSFDISLRQAEASSSITEEKEIFAGKRVLIVDDIQANRSILRLLLTRWGMSTAETLDSDQTIELLKRGELFDIVLIDYHLPMSNGLSLARKIKQLNPPKPLPLVLVSSYGGKYSESELREVGYVAAITKPLRQTMLRSTLQEILVPESRGRSNPFNPEDANLSERKISILVVEDNAINQKVILQMLKRFGLSAETVQDGAEAIRAQKLKSYDLIFMDVHMPNLDGLQATSEIRKTFPLGGRPHIVALTADSTEREKQQCLAAGMDDYIIKPVKLATLRDAIEKYAL